MSSSKQGYRDGQALAQQGKQVGPQGGMSHQEYQNLKDGYNDWKKNNK